MKAKRGKTEKKSIPLVGLLCLLLIFSILIKFYLSLKKSPFFFLQRVNFVLATQEGRVTVFSLQGSEGLIFNLQEKSKVKVTRGFGEYELGKVYPLGELEKKGGSLLKETVQENFSIPIFGYFYDPNNFDYHQSDTKKLFQSIFWQSLRNKVKTDLNKYDLVLLYLKARLLNSEVVRIENLPQDNTTFFKDKALRGESCSIEILNSTGRLGLAQQVSQMLGKAGARIIRVADTPDPQEGCLLFASKDFSKKYSLFWLNSVFDCQVKLTDEERPRADITLIIGENYWKKLHEKW